MALSKSSLTGHVLFISRLSLLAIAGKLKIKSFSVSLPLSINHSKVSIGISSVGKRNEYARRCEKKSSDGLLDTKDFFMLLQAELTATFEK